MVISEFQILGILVSHHFLSGHYIWLILVKMALVLYGFGKRFPPRGEEFIFPNNTTMVGFSPFFYTSLISATMVVLRS